MIKYNYLEHFRSIRYKRLEQEVQYVICDFSNTDILYHAVVAYSKTL